MTQNDKDFNLLCLILARMTFLSLQEKFTLIKKLDSLYNLVVLSIEDISKIIGRESKAVWNGKNAIRQAKQDMYILEKFNISTVLYTDKEYPELLKEISDPPFLLFYRGNIRVLSRNSVSIVGTRKMTSDSAKECVEFAKDACLDGVNVISGLAFGIDSKAHEGSIKARFETEDSSKIGKTVAVLPGGIDNIVPASHKKLALQIIESGGCVLSEYPPGEGALPYRFVQRNRIIAGLSPATVVIQAPPGSGAMLTAAFALDYNRDVMFHSVAFSEKSRKISLIVRNLLEKAAVCDKSNVNKLMNDPELYVNDGAPIIQNYVEFKRCLYESPEKLYSKKQNDAQLELFR